ncbi:MAG: ABC transporter permease subunit [Chloroflexota bacterium]|nr:ABC transporter permease subunit [Chloroflexota bacterium]
MLAIAPFGVLLASVLVVPVLIFGSYAFEDGNSSWVTLWTSPGKLNSIGLTLEIAAQTTAICAALAYLYVAGLMRAGPRLRRLLLLAVIVPFLTSILVRSYAWIIVLGNQGPLNAVVRWVFGPDANLQLLYNRSGVLIGMVHVLLPLFVLPLYAVVADIPPNLTRAARTLGANRVEAYLRVLLPLSLPGAAAGAVLVFVSALGFFVTPSLLGGLQETMVAQLIQRELSTFVDLPDAAVLAIVLMSGVLAILAAFRLFYPIELLFIRSQVTVQHRQRQRRAPSGLGRPGRRWPLGSARLALTGGLSRLPWDTICWAGTLLVAAFFLVPLIIVIPVSFTGEAFLHFPPDSYSLRWYEAVIKDPLWQRAFVNSLLTGAVATLLAAVIGLPLAFALVRAHLSQRVRGLLVLLVVLPALVPLIVLAIGVFVWYLRIGLIANSWSLAAAHALLGLPFLVLVVMAALRDFDARLERAARSLGAGPLNTLRLITLPILSRAIAAGLLFAFLVSLDELLIALAVTDFVTATLPVRLWEGANEEISPALAVVSTLYLLLAIVAASAALGGGGVRRRPASEVVDA